VRIIAATNSDLQQKTRDRSFRSDLYFRLRGLQFHLPPLRDRREDIPPLVLSFAERAALKYGRRVMGVTRKALSLLLSYEWPGNIRELQNEVERAVLLCGEGAALQAEHFSTIRHVIDHPYAAPAAPTAQVPDEAPRRSFLLQDRLDAVEREAIIEALKIAGGSRTKAAKMMGITRNGLAMKMRRLNITSTQD
jgi:Nif-specific regulatory protein